MASKVHVEANSLHIPRTAFGNAAYPIVQTTRYHERFGMSMTTQKVYSISKGSDRKRQSDTEKCLISIILPGTQMPGMQGRSITGMSHEKIEASTEE
jgi:hypothetical protein